MTDLVYLLGTLAAFVLLALLVGVLDRTERPAPHRASPGRSAGPTGE